ncbi:MAG TPA: protein translocase subunit SecF [Paracoccus sp.]|nr:protein translocase subunit SecF [Paracoccus sp. (in: a-proteobacteria)]
MFRLRLVPEKTRIDFFRWQWLTFGASMVAMAVSVILLFTMGLNMGIDFRGGTSIRTESSQPIDVGAYRTAMTPLGLGDVVITEVFDPTYGPDRNVAMIRVQAQEGEESMSPQSVETILQTLQEVSPDIRFVAVESVGAKVSGELIWTAVLSVVAATAAILFYIWIRFEWQFAIGAVVGLIHDVIVTLGIFVVFQIRFDLAIIAALLTIVGYSINDTVVVFDRVRENLIKFKTMPLRDILNLSSNDTLSRTVMTSTSTLLALLGLLIFGGDVIRGFVVAICLGVILGVYSTIYVAKNIVLMLGVNRTPPKSAEKGPGGTQFTTS